MVNIEMLQALHGDAFVLHCHKGKNSGVIVVDGGPNKDSQKIVDKLDSLGMIDLNILTHYDDDHIGGLLAYIKKHKNEIPFPVKEMWLNCAYTVKVSSSPNLSFGQAKNLADELSEINDTLSAEQQPLIKWEESLYADMLKHMPFADFLILSPDKNVKKMNDKNYYNSIANISRNYSRQKQVLATPLSVLAYNNAPTFPSTQQEIVNWSSIAFVIKCDNFSALMLGDSYPCTIVKSLRQEGYSETNPLRVDYVKVSHHGSLNNISNDLLDIIDCDKYLISTNGGSGTSCHPDRETIAKIVCHPKRDLHRPIHLYFNYRISSIERRGYKFLNDSEIKKYKIILHDEIQLL